MSAAIREAIGCQSDGNQRPLDRNHLSEQRARIESDERRKYVGLAVPDEGRHQRAFGEAIRSNPEGGNQSIDSSAVPGSEVNGHRLVSCIAHTRVGTVVEDRLMMEAIRMQSRTA
jgi:hypothetical protein